MPASTRTTTSRGSGLRPPTRTSPYTIGLGTDVGGLALCYRKDLFEKAGLPTDRADVDAAIGDTWDGFIELGKKYQTKSGKGHFWVDNATNILNPAQTQLGTGYAWYNKNNELDMDANKPAFDLAMNVINAGHLCQHRALV